MPGAVALGIAALTGLSATATTVVIAANVLFYAGIAAIGIGLQLLLRPNLDLGAPSSGRNARENIRAAVSEARWVLGRARVGGVLIYYRERRREVNFCLAVSEKAVDALEKLWLDEEEIPLVRTSPGQNTRREDTPLEGYIYRATATSDRPDTPAPSTAGFGPSGSPTPNPPGWSRTLPSTSPSLPYIWASRVVVSINGLSVTTHYGTPELVQHPSVGVGTFIPASGHKFRGNMSVTTYFDANGVPPAGLRAEFPDDWTSDHRLNNISYVHIWLRQPEIPRGSLDLLFERLPNVELLIRGIKIDYPGNTMVDADGNTVPVWTDNAAALRYWWLTERRGIPPEAIDEASVRAAVALCEERITYSLPPDYADFNPIDKRYTVDGLVQSGDDPVRVEAEMDFCWVGHVIEAGGIHYFRPGSDRAIVGVIRPNDIIELSGVQPAPPIQERVNAATFRLAQSSEHEFLEYSLPTQVDQASLDRDGRMLDRDLGTRPFVTGPITAGRLLAINLRRARLSAVYTYRLKPGKDLRWLSLLPTDRVLVNDPENGQVNTRMIIVGIVINEDLSVVLTLNEDRPDVYVDTLVLPPLTDRDVFVTSSGPVPIPIITDVRQATVIQPSGEQIGMLTVLWDVGDGGGYTLQWRIQGSTAWNVVQLTGASQWTLDPAHVGTTYEVRLRRVYGPRRVSEYSTIREIEVTGDTTAPAAPSGLTVTGLPTGFRLTWDAPTEADYRDTQVFLRLSSAQAGTEQLVARTPATTTNVLGLIGQQERTVTVYHRDSSGNRSGGTTATVTPLPPPEDGDDGDDGDDGQRGAGFYAFEFGGTEWPATIPSGAIPDDTPVVGDRLTLHNDDYSETRVWTGNEWVVSGQVIDGNLIIAGTIGAQKLVADEAIITSSLQLGLGTITFANLDPSLFVEALGGHTLRLDFLRNPGEGIEGVHNLPQNPPSDIIVTRNAPMENIRFSFCNTLYVVPAFGLRTIFELDFERENGERIGRYVQFVHYGSVDITGEAELRVGSDFATATRLGSVAFHVSRGSGSYQSAVTGTGSTRTGLQVPPIPSQHSIDSRINVRMETATRMFVASEALTPVGVQTKVFVAVTFSSVTIGAPSLVNFITRALVRVTSMLLVREVEPFG